MLPAPRREHEFPPVSFLCVADPRGLLRDVDSRPSSASVLRRRVSSSSSFSSSSCSSSSLRSFPDRRCTRGDRHRSGRRPLERDNSALSAAGQPTTMIFATSAERESSRWIRTRAPSYAVDEIPERRDLRSRDYGNHLVCVFFARSSLLFSIRACSRCSRSRCASGWT